MMKNIVKISVSGLAFSLEEEGYVLLDKYLGKLKNYYTQQQNGLEVVEGIEERIAELLRERMSTPEEVVSKALVQEVITIMGTPEEIETEKDNSDSKEESSYREQKEASRPDHKLYRNTDDRVLGGVCSGLAAYFDIEVALVRILFFIALMVGSLGFWAYLILWIVIPPARTVAEKCEMRGESPDFSGIQDRVKRGAERFEQGLRGAGRRMSRNMEGAGSEVIYGIGRFFAFCIGILLLMIAIPVLIAVPLSMIFSASWFFGALPQGFSQLVAFHGNALWISILAGLVFLLPFVGMLSGGIGLIFRLRPRRFRPGPLIFVCWLVSLIALIALMITATRPYYGGMEESRKEVPVYMQSDTLYVQYAGASDASRPYLWMEATASQAYLGWFEGERQSLQVVVYPLIRIVRVGAEEAIRLQLRGSASGRYVEEAYAHAEKTLPNYQLHDSLLRLWPHTYSPQNKWQGNWSEITIYLPQGKQVMLTTPYEHLFERSAPRISKGTFWKYQRRYDRRWNNRYFQEIF